MLTSFSFGFLAVQHERKPIIDKKDGSGGPNPNSKYNPHRNKEYHNEQKASTTVTPSYLNLFQGFNLAELAVANLSKRASKSPPAPSHLTSSSTTTSSNPFSSLHSFKSQDDRQPTPADSIAALMQLGPTAAAAVAMSGLGPPPQQPPPSLEPPELPSKPTPPSSHQLPMETTETNSMEKNLICNSLEFIQNLEHELNNSVNNNYGIKSELNNGRDDDRDDDCLNYDYGSLELSDNSISFDIQVPNVLPNYLSAHYVCETGSRLLFATVHWMKKNHLFSMLRWVCLVGSGWTLIISAAAVLLRRVEACVKGKRGCALRSAIG